MKTIILTDRRMGTGKSFLFECQDIIDAVPIDPVLPRDFDNTANECRSPNEMAWWGVPFIRTYQDDDPEFVKHWNGNTRYDLRCLDGGAWDRSTNWGCFGKVEEAIAEVKRRKGNTICLSCCDAFIPEAPNSLICPKCVETLKQKYGKP